VRKYHIYIAIWTAVLGKELRCVREPTNSRERYAIAVIQGSLLFSRYK